MSCVLSLIVNWGAREVALRTGLVDRPDGHRKLQSQAVPLAGGVAIFTVILIVIGALIVGDAGWRQIVLAHGTLGIGLLLAGSLIVLLGVLDDYYGLRGRQKLAGQLVASGIMVIAGLSIERVQFLDWSFDLGLFAVPFTIFWLVGAMNALNLLDGIDGLAGTIGCILSGAVAVMAFMTGHETIALVATILTGSLVGFLRFNLPPASMYLGDAGSMLIGLAVGVMAIRASLKGPGTVLLAVPLALWTIPIFDTAAAIVRRKLTGRSIYETDRAHLHHHLVERIGHRMTLVLVAGASLLTSAAALLAVWWKHDSIALLCGGFVVLMFMSLRIFGHTEVILATVRGRAFLRSIFWPHHPADTHDGWDDVVHLQGTRQWGILWETLTENANRLGFVQVRLDLNLPTLGEGYHASWTRPSPGEPKRQWRLDLPLIADSRVLGYIKVAGERGDAAGRNFEQLMELVEQVETRLSNLLESGEIFSEPGLEEKVAASGVATIPIPRLTIREAALESE